MAVAYDDKERKPSRAQREEREQKLIRMLKSEEEDALSYAQSEATSQQITALKRYFGEAYGDEEEGRSQVCTREVFEVIEWQRNDYARIFSSGGRVVEVEATSPEEENHARDAENYLQWIMFSDNPGAEIIDDFVFGGLLHRRGYAAVYWRDKEHRAPQTVTGLNIMQVAQLAADPSVEIVGQDFDEESGGGISLVIKATKSPPRAEIVSIAPEDMRFNGRVGTLDDARYAGRVVRMMKGEAMRLWPEKEDEIREYSGPGTHSGQTRSGDAVRAQRFADNDASFDADGNDMALELEILEEYLRVDLDDDGYPEMIRSYRCGDLMLEEEEVEENPFASWTPIRVPHRFLGLSMHDITEDLQRQSTVLTRAGLDAVYQSVVNREAYDKNRVELDQLLATYSGAKVGVDGSPGDAIMPLTGGLDTARTAWEALEIIKQRIEDRTGATRQTRGLDADQLQKEHSGKALGMLQLNADARKEMVARNLGIGLSQLGAKLYRLVCRNQNEARQVKVGGKWCQFDPRTWNANLRVTISAGGINQEHSLTGLMLIGQEQEKVIELLGPGNPNVTPQNRYAYQQDLCRQAGRKSADAFFTEIPEGWQPPEQPDPAMAKLQADMQLAQMKMQQEKAQTTLQYEKDMALAQQQQQDELRRADVQAQADADKAALEQGKLALEAERLAFEKAKTEAELELAAKKLELEGMKIQVSAQDNEAGREHDMKKMDKEHRNQRKLAADPDKANDMDAEDAGKPSTAEAISELAKALTKPVKVKRGKDGKLTGFE